VANDDPLTIFVAMPGTTLGERAKWTDLKQIKAGLYDPLAAQLATRLGREVKVQIEKERQESGPINHTMFAEALNAEVYIADLTGANPNVYLELGVRWAVRDNVTVLVSQDQSDVRFNVSGNRVVPYSNRYDELAEAHEVILNMIIYGLAKKNVDSPVRLGSDLVTVPKAGIEALHSEITQLRHARGDDLFNEAMTAPHHERVAKLRRVLQVNDTRADVHGELGKALRKEGHFSGAIHELAIATRLEPGVAQWWRELGIAQSRKEDLQNAVRSLTEAVKLDPADVDAYSGLGGAHRRIARATGDHTELRKARDAYRKASEVRPDDLYALANAARLDVQLAETEDERLAAVGSFRDLNSLADWKTKNPQADWAWLDLADTFAFSGDAAGALAALRRGMERFEPEHRATTAQTAMEPVLDMLGSSELPEPVVDALNRMLDAYKAYL
jgi:Flp pilus assembly protein TadD